MCQALEVSSSRQLLRMSTQSILLGAFAVYLQTGGAPGVQGGYSGGSRFVALQRRVRLSARKNMGL